MSNKQPKSKQEKLAILFTILTFAIVVISTIIRILNDVGVFKFKGHVAYVVVDIVLLVIAGGCLITAIIFEKIDSNLKQQHGVKKDTKKRK